MSSFATGNLFENPLVLVAILLVSALSNWLIKRRQGKQAANRPDGDGPLPSPGQPQERSPRELDLQEALRQLLGGGPPAHAPQPPPVPPVMRDAQPAEGWSDEEQFQSEQAWMDEPQETDEAALPPAIQSAPPSRPNPALARASAARIEASERHEEVIRRFEQLNEQGRHPATVVNSSRRRSGEGTRAIGLLRDHGTVRQAFVASLVFGSPKAFES